jgi:peptide/nickel transport system permease protein
MSVGVAASAEVNQRRAAGHPVLAMIGRRLGLGVLTLVAVSMLVFLATQVLPGNAAYAVLQNTATPARLHALQARLHLNQPVTEQYWHWISGVLSGNLGRSLTGTQSVGSLVSSRAGNSAVLVAAAGVIGTIIGVLLGVYAAARRDRWIDHALSTAALALASMPDFVVAVLLVILFSTVVLQVLPAVSVIPPGVSPLDRPKLLVLPVATLVLVIVPYIFRMTRAAMIEALSSEYVEMADLNGFSRHRVLFVHALRNAVPAAVQVVGLNLLYLAGGIVVVEYVFNYPGLGQGLVQAVSDRDIPTIQFIVLLLAAFYVVVNIATDVLALLASPRRRLPRSG